MKSVFRLLAAASLLLPLFVSAADQFADGIVKKIDASSQRIMVAHGPIASIGMMPMTMMFKVKEPVMLKQVREGDKIRFLVEEIGGDYTITRIEAKK